MLWVDYAKGISITLVVLYHVWHGIDRRGDQIRIPEGLFEAVNPVLQAVRMPLFFFVSGLFAANSMRKGWGTFAWGKIGGLVWPYLIWSTLQTAVAWVLARASGAEPAVPLHSLPSRLLFDPVDHFWFLYVLFLALLLFYALLRWTGRRWVVLSTGIVLVLLPLNVDFRVLGLDTPVGRISLADWGPLFQLMQFFFYMALGTVAAARLFAVVPQLRLRWLGTIALAGIFLVVALVHGVGVTRDSSATWLWITWPTGVSVALIAVAATLATSVLLERLHLLPLLMILGKYSLYLFVLHVLVGASIRILLLRLGVTDFAVHLVIGLGGALFLPLLAAILAKRLGLTWLFSLQLSPPAPATTR